MFLSDVHGAESWAIVQQIAHSNCFSTVLNSSPVIQNTLSVTKMQAENPHSRSRRPLQQYVFFVRKL